MTTRWRQQIAGEKSSSVTWRSLPGEPVLARQNFETERRDVIFIVVASRAGRPVFRAFGATAKIASSQSEQNCRPLSRNHDASDSRTNVAINGEHLISFDACGYDKTAMDCAICGESKQHTALHLRLVVGRTAGV
jgi:hypothetical protein